MPAIEKSVQSTITRLLNHIVASTLRAVPLVFAVVALALVSCDGESTHVTVDASAVLGDTQDPDQMRAELVARAIALALDDAETRRNVRDAMRASRVTEHKLVLQEFIRTPAGEILLVEGARRLGLTPADLAATVGGLPELDFYLPSRHDRRRWRAEPGLRVGAALRLGTTINAFTPRGLTSRVARGEQGVDVTFLLERAERKSRRIGAQPAGAGPVIEDINDGQLSGSIVEYLPNGRMKVTDLADYMPADGILLLNCPPSSVESCDDGGSGGGGGQDVTLLRDLVVIDVCDNGDCAQGNEFEWHTYFSTDNGSTWINRVDLRLEGVPSNIEVVVNMPVLYNEPRFPDQMIQSDVVETDSFSPDDHFNPSPQWLYNENGALKFEGELRCDYPKYYGGTYTCGTPYFWREVNQTFVW